MKTSGLEKARFISLSHWLGHPVFSHLQSVEVAVVLANGTYFGQHEMGGRGAPQRK